MKTNNLPKVLLKTNEAQQQTLRMMHARSDMDEAGLAPVSK
jgi:hypothetical protein